MLFFELVLLIIPGSLLFQHLNIGGLRFSLWFSGVSKLQKCLCDPFQTEMISILSLFIFSNKSYSGGVSQQLENLLVYQTPPSLILVNSSSSEDVFDVLQSGNNEGLLCTASSQLCHSLMDVFAGRRHVSARRRSLQPCDHDPHLTGSLLLRVGEEPGESYSRHQDP